MQNQTLFGHLVGRFSTHPENLATEGLNYILNQSVVARQAFIDFLKDTGVVLPETLNFSTQAVGEDQAIPDLVGVTTDGKNPLLVEVKFWAGLTENQPVTYLERLSAGSTGLLLFIAPSQRLGTLWPELIRRCQKADMPIGPIEQSVEGLRLRKVNETHILALTSWRRVLTVMLNEVEAINEKNVAADIIQLQGLCNRMDSDAFLPLQSADLASIHGKRILQYIQLTVSLINRLKKEEWVSTEGLSTTVSAKEGKYGHYMEIHGHSCLVVLNPEWWNNYRETPLWFRIWFTEEARMRLAHLEHADPPGMIKVGTELIIPLYPPIGQERDQVLEALVKQVEKIAEYLASPIQAEQK